MRRDSENWGTIDHTADLGLWAEAETLPGVFRTMCIALSRLMVEGARKGETSSHPFEASGDGLADLLVQVLNEVVYLLDAEGLLVTDLEVEELSPARLSAQLLSIAFDPGQHTPGEAVKAVTYHETQVEQTPSGWRAQVLLDV